MSSLAPASSARAPRHSPSDGWRRGATTLVLLCLLVVATETRAAAPAGGKAKLRDLVTLPRINLEIDCSWDVDEGFTFAPNPPDVPAEVAALTKAMTGRPSDAERYLRLGNVYDWNHDTTNAHAAYAAALRLYRQQVELQPDDGPLLIKFADALHHADKEDEADSVLRRAVQVEPKAWRGWLARGRFFLGRAFDALSSPPTSGRDRAPGRDVVTWLLGRRPSPEQVARSQQALADAHEAMNRAVTLAPRQSEARAGRAAFYCAQGELEATFRLIRGEESDPTTISRAAFTRAGLPDLWEAARLDRTNYVLITCAAGFEAFAEVATKFKAEPPPPKLIDTLPEASQRSIREAVAWLTDLSQSPNRRLAGGALEGLGFLQTFAFADNAGALQNARRAVAADSTLESAWDLLLALLDDPGHLDELVRAGEKRVQLNGSARNHFILAKCYDRRGDLSRTEGELRQAQRLDPKDFPATLGLAAVCLKGDDPTLLAQAEQWLDKAYRLLDPNDTSLEGRLHGIDFLLTASLYHGLTDHLDLARQTARQVFKIDKENEHAKEILAALGGG